MFFNTILLVKCCVRKTIANKNKSFEKELDLMMIEKITDLIPHRTLNAQIDEIPDYIPLVEYSFNVTGKIDTLIGAEIFFFFVNC